MCIFREEIGGKGRVVALSCTVDIVCLYHYNIYIYVCVCVSKSVSKIHGQQIMHVHTNSQSRGTTP